MSERYTGTVPAEAVSPEIAAALSMRPVPGSRYRVTVEQVEESDEEKWAALRAAIQKGRDEIAAGLAIDGEDVFARLRAKHFPETVKRDGQPVHIAPRSHPEAKFPRVAAMC
jgi:predicted transcriptional regulator